MSCDDESAQCKQARRDYDNAENERMRIEAELAEIKDVRNGAAGALGVGAVILAGIVVVSGPVGWIGALAGAAIIGGGGGTLVAQNRISELRQRCEAARQRMMD